MRLWNTRLALPTFSLKWSAKPWPLVAQRVLLTSLLPRRLVRVPAPQPKKKRTLCELLFSFKEQQTTNGEIHTHSFEVAIVLLMHQINPCLLECVSILMMMTLFPKPYDMISLQLHIIFPTLDSFVSNIFFDILVYYKCVYISFYISFSN